MPTVVIGTAGHIDHGKTALLRALTGIDADRLPEERARGMTIDVGYAHLAFHDGVELDFVDVPGHDRLIGNMLVGAGEIDAAMLVVAADDGPRPQTLEHLQLLDALAIADGLTVVTKTDLVDDARVREVTAALRGVLAGTCLADVPIVAVSAVSGAGVDELRNRLRTIRDAIVDRWRGESGASSRAPRLAIDRVFTPRGKGVVVTGTLRGGELVPGATLRREPGGEPLRVRELQVHGQALARHDGGRTALNVAGEAAPTLQRGDVLSAAASAVRGTRRLLVELRRPASVVGAGSWPPKGRTGLRLHVGTAQVDTAVRPVRGAESFADLTLRDPVATYAGERAVLRDPASGAVIAGVRVVDAEAPRGASRRRVTPERLAALARAVDAAASEAIAASRLDVHGVVPAGAAGGREATPRSLAIADDIRQVLAAEALDAVATHHRDAALSPGLPLPRARATLLRRLRSLATVERRSTDLVAVAVAAVLDDLISAGRLARRGDALRDPALAGEPSADLVAAMARLEAALAVAAPPGLAEAAAAAGCPPEGIRALQADGRIVRLAPDLAWSAAAYHGLAATALERARRAPLTPAALRDATGTSRKYVLAILEDLGRRQILQRTPEGHIPGPRAPRARAEADTGAPA